MDLPDGWEAHEDDMDGRTFFHHEASGKTSWVSSRSRSLSLSTAHLR